MIDWKSVVNNAVSMLVAATFVGAGAIVWKNASTIDETITTHTNKLKVNQTTVIDTQSKLKASQETLTNNIVDLKEKIELLERRVDSLQQVVKETEIGSRYTIPESTIPFVLPQYELVPAEAAQLRAGEKSRIEQSINSKAQNYQVEFSKNYKEQVQQN